MFRYDFESPLSHFVTRSARFASRIAVDFGPMCYSDHCRRFEAVSIFAGATVRARRRRRMRPRSTAGHRASRTCRSSERSAVVAAKSPASVDVKRGEPEARRAVGPMLLAVANPVLDPLVERQEAERRQLGIDGDELALRRLRRARGQRPSRAGADDRASSRRTARVGVPRVDRPRARRTATRTAGRCRSESVGRA